MNKIFLTFSFILFSTCLAAQPCDFPFSASNTCLTAPLVCSLDGYCSSNQGSTNTGTPNAFCGIVENNSWVSFIAGSTTFELAITVDNCNLGNGLQAQFFQTDDCSFYTSVSNCLDPVLGTANLVCSNLTIGEVYYLMMDGKQSDVCDYQYQLVSGVILSPADVFVETVDTICVDETLIIFATAVSPNSNLVFNWSTMDGNIISDPQAASIEVDAPGMYEIFVEDDQGCTATTTVQVVEASDFFPNIATPDTLNCLDNLTEILQASADPPNGQIYFFEWTTMDGNIISGADTPNPEVDSPGQYFVIVTNSFGCEKIDSVQVFADVNTPIAVAGSGGELDCLTEMIELDGQQSSSGINFSYEWTTVDGNILNGETTLTPTIDSAGTYILEVTNSVNGCTATDAVVITLNDAEPTGAEIIIKQPCFGETDGSIFIESVVGGIAPYEYAFDGINFGMSPEIVSIPAGDYPLVIRDATGCEWFTNVNITPQIELTIDLGEDQFIALGCEGVVQAEINYPLNLIDTITWSPDFDCDFPCEDTSFIPLETATYFVEVIDVNGCIAMDTISYVVQKDRHVYIPNAFTPNDDGVNDHFVVYGGKDVEEVVSFQVFDRWGETVMARKNIQPNEDIYGWNGELNKKRMNENVFVYYVEVLFVDGFIGEYSGSVTLIR